MKRLIKLFLFGIMLITMTSEGCGPNKSTLKVAVKNCSNQRIDTIIIFDDPRYLNIKGQTNWVGSTPCLKGSSDYIHYRDACEWKVVEVEQKDSGWNR